MLTLRGEKAYLIDFSLKFNEIKFCTVLMNWLIWEQMFTYFNKKFRPVNRMYCIECGVNSSLLTSFQLLHKVCGTLDHCFIMTYSFHKEDDILQIYVCVIFRETGHHAQANVTSGALCPFFGREKNTNSSCVDFASHCLLWLLLLRLAAAAATVLLPSQYSLLTSVAFAPDSEATRISLMASSPNFIYFFSGHCLRPTIACLV